MFFFNNALNTFYLQLYGVGDKVKDQSDRDKGYSTMEGRKEGSLYLSMHSTLFIYSYMVLDIR